MKYKPYSDLIGGFSPSDGTIDFYLRIHSLINNSDTVLDLGAGRAAWFDDDTCKIRKEVRLLQGKAHHVIAADIDTAVLANKASDQQILIKNESLGLKKESIDLIVADYVLEHIDDPEGFFEQINFVLKHGGWFCARTPHKYSYVALFASLIKNSKHVKVLSKVQPDRKEIDVFPTKYKLNTMKAIRKNFPEWKNYSHIHRSNPAYFFGSRVVFEIQNILHKVVFKELCGNLFIFLQKT